MSHKYQAVGWTPSKKKYDLTVVAFIVLYLGAFIGVSLATQPNITAETLILRSFGSLAFVLLTGILLIGPLARFDRRFLPVLYNRRHLGVATFLVAAVHGGLAMFQFHALGDLNPIVSALVSDGSYVGSGASSPLPFHPLGLVALVILFLMAATSHDFWLANLTPRVWKTLHMLVYVAYAALLGHVALGALQGEAKGYLWPIVIASGVAVFGLQLLAGARERRLDRPVTLPTTDGFVRAVEVERIPDTRAHVFRLGDERVAIFRNGDTISCVSNVCRHQMGPIGEGKIIDGCITCPWHGFQYDPADGCSPPPFTERIETYDVLIQDGFVWVKEQANALGTKAQTGKHSAGVG